MSTKKKPSPESIVREIKRKTRRKYSAEEKIRIVLEGLRGEQGITDLCRREGIISLDGGYSYSKNSGTFPIKMEFPYISLGVKIVSDLAITFNYRYINHNQELFASQDYKAHLFDVGFMYTY
jgi:transposase